MGYASSAQVSDRAGSAIAVAGSVGEHHRAAGHLLDRILGRQPRRQPGHGDHAVGARRADAGSRSHRVPDEAHRQIAEPRAQLADRPLDVPDRVAVVEADHPVAELGDRQAVLPPAAVQADRERVHTQRRPAGAGCRRGRVCPATVGDDRDRAGRPGRRQCPHGRVTSRCLSFPGRLASGRQRRPYQVFDGTQLIGSRGGGIPHRWGGGIPRPAVRSEGVLRPRRHERALPRAAAPLIADRRPQRESGGQRRGPGDHARADGVRPAPTPSVRASSSRCSAGRWKGPDHTLRWIYRVVGRDTGEEHARFILAVPWAPSDLPCRLLGLQLQITLNGVENASSGELDAYLELAQAARS